MSKEYSSDKIRNVAIIGHASTGKTTLNEQLLYIMGSIPKAGKVEEKNTVSDFEEEEKERLISIHTAVTYGEKNDIKINLFDCPGMGDFVGQVRSALRVSEAAIVLIDSVDGIQMETEKMWKYATEYNTPRIVFVNKMDKENANFLKVLTEVEEKFRKPVIPLQLPIGAGPDFKGIIDLIEMKALIPNAEGKTYKKEDVPADLVELAKEYREKLIEAIAETDDEMTMKFLEGEELSEEEVKNGLSKTITNGKVILATCGSAVNGTGVFQIVDIIAKEFPSPIFAQEVEGHKPGKSGDKIKRKIDNSEPLSLFVFKTRIDQYSGVLNYFKVETGELHSDSELILSKSNRKIKPGHIFLKKAGKLIETDKISAGDIGIISKVEGVHTGNTLCDAKNPIEFADLKMPQPVYALAIHAKEKKDEDKMNQLLHRSAEEDPTFHLQFNGETKQNVISGMGELQLNIILDHLKKANKIETVTELPRIAYRETITKKAKADYRHKKQSGGHGQFGEVWLELEPVERGNGLDFVDKIVGGSIPKQFIPAVEKGVVEGMEEGTLAKYPIVDIRTTVYDGKYHPVDSNELSFKLAARGALKKAIEAAKPILLEPIMEVEIHVDKDLMGSIFSDVTSRRGKVLGSEAEGGDQTSQTQVIKAYIPQAETQKYIIDLRSMTGGRATFEMRFSHYDPLTGRDADNVIKKRLKELEESK